MIYYLPQLIRARAPKVRGPIEIVMVIRARAPKVRGPIEIGLIIRARAPKVRGPIEIGLVLIIIIIIQALWGAFWGL